MRGVLQVLPSGLVLPPLPYLVGLAVATLGIGGYLAARRPPITRRLVAAFTPWMVVGAAWHALYQLKATGPVTSPLFSAPTVYLTTALLACFVLSVALVLEGPSPSRSVGAVGLLVALGSAGWVVGVGADSGSLALTVPLAAAVAAAVIAWGIVRLVGRFRPAVPARTGLLGSVVVFGHVLDGLSTAVGVDLYGTGERSPVPRAIMEFAGSLPTAPILGTGWLFVLVKIAVATVVVVLFADLAAETPHRANVLLGIVAAVGLGPGAHNLLLFAAVGPL